MITGALCFTLVTLVMTLCLLEVLFLSGSTLVSRLQTTKAKRVRMIPLPRLLKVGEGKIASTSMCDRTKFCWKRRKVMQQIQDLVFLHGGALSGSFVRDVITRGEEFAPNRDVDVLLTYDCALEFLDDLQTNYPQAEFIPLSLSEEDKILHYHVRITEQSSSVLLLLDIFAGSDEEHTYLCSPDADVNCLCYDRLGFFLWYPVLEENYGIAMDEHDIIERIMKKQAVMLVHEWEEGEAQEIMVTRRNKLASKGWTLLNS